MCFLKQMELTTLQTLAREIAAEHGFSVVQTTFGREPQGWVLRVLIERPGADPMAGSGVDLSACTTVSRALGDRIEAGQLVDKAYTLEVSSPGVERPLVSPEDFQRFVGREARFKLRKEVGGRKRLVAEIIACDDEHVRVALGKERNNLDIPHSYIARANLVFTPKW